MPLAKSKRSVGLGNALMNDRFGKGKGSERNKTSAIARTNHSTGEQYLINERQDAAWVKMRSVTEQGALDEFLATAELAGTDFTADKMNSVKIIHTDQRNPYLLSAHEQRSAKGKHREHRARLTVPRRPRWDASTTPQELDALERKSFLDWRRGLAELQENNDLLMTPFERNIEVWRQMWRVIERSDLVVQIVDARNPLLFRCEDLESYVKAVDAKKENLLLINKADMMTPTQRKAWAKYLREAGIAFEFFSAHLAKQLNEARDDDDDDDDDDESESDDELHASAQGHDAPNDQDDDADSDQDSRILTVEELEDIFLRHAPTDTEANAKLQVGLVGYPNVGKSSTINSLMGAKKVSVSSTPGKTKHFQTIHLSDRVILCDCPGLVFPNFAFTKADLVCNGVLPIDQMREHTGPAALVAQRIPRLLLEALYGIRIQTRPAEEGGTGVPTAEELLRAHAMARGFCTQGLGQPDESRAARRVLKDYVNGKLVFVQPPPGFSSSDDDEDEMTVAAGFNRDLHRHHLALIQSEKQRPVPQTLTSSQHSRPEDLDDEGIALSGPKTERLDAGFFAPRTAQAHMRMPFNYKFSEQGAAAAAGTVGKPLSGRKARTMVALEKGVDAKDVVLSGKKHFKGGARNGKGKKRRGVNLGE
ncbi:ribosome biogenesis GTPase Lsg1 [Ophiocordyceps camponoti-floridani]|uniref:Ribosome biogenesis GTPase Lsg1 n=1 Tax=Ophiocordyceps camponoti-floridani TaxID=2030778 RepID=A0A8H4Q503_9HYPO|nr:ribosome biogenesis GTPase Lsg1 [Ophiocordyceps camponoti-floridani]